MAVDLVDTPNMFMLQHGLLYNVQLQPLDQVLRNNGKHLLGSELADYLDMARAGHTLSVWNLELGVSAYLGQRTVKERMDAEQQIRAMHGVYSGIIDQAQQLAEQTGAAAFAVIATRRLISQPITMDLPAVHTAKNDEWELHPTVNLYLRKS